MSKSLFDENFKYTDELNRFASKVSDAIDPIFKEMVGKGYSPREISHMMMHEVLELEMETIIELDAERYRKENGVT